MRHRKDPRSHETRQTPALAPDNSRVHFNYNSITAGVVQMMSPTFPHGFPSEPTPNGPKQTSFECALQSTLHFPFKKKTSAKKKIKHLVPKYIRVYISSIIYGWETEPHIWGRGSSLVTCTPRRRRGKKSARAKTLETQTDVGAVRIRNCSFVISAQKKCTPPHCKTLIWSSLDKLKEADKHSFHTWKNENAVCVSESRY